MWNPFRGKRQPPDDDADLERARREALTQVLGPPDDMELHSPIPFFMGHAVGGAADVLSFSGKLPGVAYVTSELIGPHGQLLNRLGNYEICICHRSADEHGASLLSRLAYATLESVLQPSATMDIGPATPHGSTIAAFLFSEFARFTVRGKDAGILLCVGITQEELGVARMRGGRFVEDALRKAGVYPYTDWFRHPVPV